nr:MAG TPA: hypothetical protein [Caudoviricetes sp.]
MFNPSATLFANAMRMFNLMFSALTAPRRGRLCFR